MRLLIAGTVRTDVSSWNRGVLVRVSLAGLVGLVGIAHAGDRFPPSEVRAKVIGCWQLSKGQKLRITPFGKHSVEARLEGQITTHKEFAPWQEADHGFEIACPRAASSAAFACRTAPDGDRLLVRVFEIVASAAPKPIEDIRAARCRP